MGCLLTLIMNSSRNITSSMPPEQTLIYTIAMILNTFILPVIVFTGLVGNTVSCMVFVGKDLRRLSSSVYVLAVLISDTGTLLSLLSVWLEVLGFQINHMQGICQLFVYLTYVCSFLSAWYMVCITVENFITICHPMKVKVMCTKNRASAVVVILAAAAMLMYSVTVITTQVRTDAYNRQLCHQNPDFDFLVSVYTYVDSIVTLLLPVSSIGFMLVAMGFSIANTVRWRKNSPRTDSARRCIKSPQVRVTKMLFALSTTFLIMNAPLHCMRLYYLLRDSANVPTQMSHTAGLVHLFLLFISYSHCAVKFFLFIGFSKNFRKSLKESGCMFSACTKDVNSSSQVYV
ncbi:lysophosphatidic acid receptor 6-like [Haliotis rufescens]|uniref:lysophosphatidic acid receptor 6-like n=1 Tax=Haliotis rufescens TaxID=6454 RepID=UPI001EAFDBAF|nr:lysophosphatidic acid receptor 6-like [Haliotis rufescens]